MAKKVAGEVSWPDSEYPFELAKCGKCLTQHHAACSDGCDNPQHAEFRRVVTKAIPEGIDRKLWAESHLAICLKLRKRFARFYPKASKP